MQSLFFNEDRMMSSFFLMFKTVTKRYFRLKVLSIRHIPALMIVFTISFAQSQSLESEWKQYSAIDAQLQTVVLQEKSLSDLQMTLNAQKQEFEKGERWYNSWIIKMRLAGINQSQVQIADSLNTIRNQIMDYRREKELILRSIKRHYEEYLSEVSRGDSIATSLSLAEEMTGVLDISAFDSFALPDYSELVNSLGQDEQLRKLIFLDLSRLLNTKLNFIDSLLVEKEKDLKLLMTLQDFHQDIGLQSDADLEISTSGGKKYNPLMPVENISNYDYREGMTQFSKGNLLAEPAADLDDDVAHRSLNNIEIDILRLIQKQQEYEKLLGQIQNELPAP